MGVRYRNYRWDIGLFYDYLVKFVFDDTNSIYNYF